MSEKPSADLERKQEELLMDEMLQRPSQLLLASTIGHQNGMLIWSGYAGDRFHEDAVEAALAVLWDAYLPPESRRMEPDWAAIIAAGRNT
jgi:hypothetical protein